VSHDFLEQTIVSSVSGVFGALALELDTRFGPSKFLFQTTTSRKSEYLRELKSLDFGPRDLSSQRCDTPFKWINKSEQTHMVTLDSCRDRGARRYRANSEMETVDIGAAVARDFVSYVDPQK
jgi:hypothetical protein